MENICNGLLHVSAADSHSFGRIKVYRTGYAEVMAASKPRFCPSKMWEEEGEHLRHIRKDETAETDIERSRRRAAAKVRDYALSTDFKWFVTLTLSPEQVDRYDISAVTKRMRTVLDNAVRRKGLTYVLVPELHKDGAIHFHGFFNDVPGLSDSGTYTGGLAGHRPRRPHSAVEAAQWEDSGAHKIYNVDWWRLGFSSAIALYGDYQAAVEYVCKYVKKASDKIGGRWYLSGGGVSSPHIIYTNVMQSEVQQLPNSYTYSVAGTAYAMWRGRIDEVLDLLNV